MRQGIRGDGELADANQTPVSGSFTTRHAVQGDGTATVTDAPPPLALSDFVVPVGRTADLLAFTLPSPATDTSATFTVRHGVQGDGTATVTDPPAALALADFAPPTGHTADLLFLATASANADNSAGFYRTTERGGSDTPLDEDDKFGANNDGKVTRIRYQRGNRLSVNQAFYTGPSFESYSLTEGLRIHLQTEDGVVSWLSTDYTNAGSAGGGYTDWKLIPQSARTLIRNIRRD